MNTKDLIAKAYNSSAFVDLRNSGAKDLTEFQEIVKTAIAAEQDGFLEKVLVPISQAHGSYNLLFITGVTERGRAQLGEP